MLSNGSSLLTPHPCQPFSCELNDFNHLTKTSIIHAETKSVEFHKSADYSHACLGEIVFLIKILTVNIHPSYVDSYAYNPSVVCIIRACIYTLCYVDSYAYNPWSRCMYNSCVYIHPMLCPVSVFLIKYSLTVRSD